jgi:hypothetical protein
MTIYISVDVEAASLVPNLYSLLSVGACIVDDPGDCFHRIIAGTETPGVQWEPDTHDWWTHEDQADAMMRLNSKASAIIPYRTEILNVAEDFHTWLTELEDELFFVAWPASYDYPFIQLLFKNAWLKNPFNYRTIDIKSYACGKLGKDFGAGHDDFPEWMQDKPEFPHDALSDAIAQARVFSQLLDYERE